MHVASLFTNMFPTYAVGMENGNKHNQATNLFSHANDCYKNTCSGGPNFLIKSVVAIDKPAVMPEWN